jgi:cyanophycinase
MHVLSSGDGFELARRRPTEVPDVKKSHAIEAQSAG